MRKSQTPAAALRKSLMPAAAEVRKSLMSAAVSVCDFISIVGVLVLLMLCVCANVLKCIGLYVVFAS